MNNGYARVSTLDQNLNGECRSLRRTAAKKMFSEKGSGASGPNLGRIPRIHAGNLIMTVFVGYQAKVFRNTAVRVRRI
jgi:DNA invertase Pin-like site-specific DNA recombinase